MENTHSTKNELFVATTNPHKVDEIRSMIGSAVPSVRGTADRTDLDEVPETGETFRENADMKARGYYEQIKQPTLADDSGLCVQALDGKPGVYSARFAGSDATDRENNQKLLEELKDVPDERRQARFECCLVLYYSRQLIITTVGTCEGKILAEPRGSSGFGYDPLFQPDGYDRTFGELSSDEKAQLSHRADAIQQLHHLIDARRGILWTSDAANNSRT